jgi:hypothetical protein
MTEDQLCNYCQHNEGWCKLYDDTDTVPCEIFGSMRKPIKIRVWIKKLPIYIIRFMKCKHFLINPDEDE